VDVRSRWRRAGPPAERDRLALGRFSGSSATGRRHDRRCGSRDGDLPKLRTDQRSGGLPSVPRTALLGNGRCTGLPGSRGVDRSRG
jgi:hypothetical protein